MKLLLGCDFDGTLAPIRPTPEEVRIDPLLEDVLVEASRHDGVAVAIISGRDVDDVRLRIGRVPAWLAGSHGLELYTPDGAPIRVHENRELKLAKTLEDLIRDAGARLEWKKFGVALHWRGVSGMDEAHPLVVAFANWAKQNGLEMIHGRLVAEARVPGGGKVESLKEIAEREGATRVVFAGDDLTDAPALQWAAANGRGLFLASEERTPPAGVEVVRSRKELAKIFRQEIDAVH